MRFIENTLRPDKIEPPENIWLNKQSECQNVWHAMHVGRLRLAMPAYNPHESLLRKRSCRKEILAFLWANRSCKNFVHGCG
jgi:hypothetical protein